MKDLRKAVLKWWRENKNDTYEQDGEDYNIYKYEPEFVKIAKNIKETPSVRNYRRAIESYCRGFCPRPNVPCGDCPLTIVISNENGTRPKIGKFRKLRYKLNTEIEKELLDEKD